MLGAIVGDIVGSVYEWNNIKRKDFPLFRGDCFFTDDTVMTCAVAEAVTMETMNSPLMTILLNVRRGLRNTLRKCMVMTCL